MDLSGEPVLDPDARMELAAVALDAGLEYRAPGIRLTPPPAATPDTGGVPVVAVIGTGQADRQDRARHPPREPAARRRGRSRWSCRWDAAGRRSR